MLCGPLSVFTGKDGMLKPTAVNTIKQLLETLRKQGHDVFSAHELEQWGKAFGQQTSLQALARDKQGTQVADYVFIMPSFAGHTSLGTSLELGFLDARMSKGNGGRPIKGLIILRHKGNSHPELRGAIEGLKAEYPTKVEVLDFKTPRELIQLIKERTQTIPLHKQAIGRMRLAIGRKLNTPKGATYFTKKQRRRPV